MLITANGTVPVGAQIEVSFTIAGYPVEINTKGEWPAPLLM